ncbi:SgcJ/EcaC family oxidoreductase [Streptomyces jeddahensis]|uniref:Calcium/calmodulin dependent protein kinase II association n=1 Tax=Streptomyces jeddahensis TaxID=1716141 RepID=A0A177I0I1_9ACTN|nr:SgcJ/EcaC family oxidoreductase [Streptomyces jeddahensis]OAH16447.1 calcium/calmodulin dependent protein kinase II association [Streptomyces jeddahensis]
MKRQIRTRAALVTAGALVAAGTVAVGVGVASPEHREAPAAAGFTKPAKAEIAGLFDQWNAALQTGDPEKVADRYAADAVLLPTASPKIRTNRAEIVDYFEHFLQNKPKGEKIRTVVNVLDRDSAIDAGLYQFHLTDPATGEKKTVEARYTYEYEKRGGKWLIVNHHSSVLPAGG